jgi:hypothetical protein
MPRSTCESSTKRKNLFFSYEIHLGGWCGREGRSRVPGQPLGDQDIVLATR